MRRCATTRARCGWMQARVLGMLSGYYFADNYTQNNPYPTLQGGANVPGLAH